LPDAAATAITSREALTTKHHFVTRIPEDLPRAKADYYKVIEVLTNLLDNAAKWSPAGGTVTARMRDGVLTVDDEGPGVAEHDRPHVFERFFRGDRSGLGLGLAIAKSVVELHSGRIWVEDSAEGAGSTFVVRLPLSAGDVVLLSFPLRGNALHGIRGVVLRSFVKEKNGDPVFENHVEYDGIENTVKEKIIRLIFEMQREELQWQK